MKTIALICASKYGHHPMSFRFFTKALLELGCTVAALTPDPEDLSSWMAENCPNLSNQLRIVELRYGRRLPVQGRTRVFFEKLAWVRFIAKSIRSANIDPDLVINTWLDACLTPGLTSGIMDLAFPFQWTGLWFHPWYLRRNQRYAWLRRGIMASHNALLSRNCRAVGILDEGVAGRLRTNLPGKPVIVFPDVADASWPDPAYAPAREIRERARGRKVIGIVGSLEKRKGILNLINVARRSIEEDWFFVFAGELWRNTFLPEDQQEIAEFISSSPANCFLHLRRLPGEPQFNAVVDSVDVLFAVYENFLSSSNQLTKAAIFRKPILVSRSFCMGERVRRYGIGIEVPENDAPACVDALRRLCDPKESATIIQPAGFDQYRHDHSLEKLRESFAQLIGTE